MAYRVNGRVQGSCSRAVLPLTTRHKCSLHH